MSSTNDTRNHDRRDQESEENDDNNPPHTLHDLQRSRFAIKSSQLQPTTGQLGIPPGLIVFLEKDDTAAVPRPNHLSLGQIAQDIVYARIGGNVPGWVFGSAFDVSNGSSSPRIHAFTERQHETAANLHVEEHRRSGSEGVVASPWTKAMPDREDDDEDEARLFEGESRGVRCDFEANEDNVNEQQDSMREYNHEFLDPEVARDRKTSAVLSLGSDSDSSVEKKMDVELEERNDWIPPPAPRPRFATLVVTDQPKVPIPM